MLAGLRNDNIPVAYKKKNTKTVTRQMFKPKPVFAKWRADDAEWLKRAFDSDMKMIDVLGITVGNQTDANDMLRHVSLKFGELKEIFHYL